MKQKYSVIEMIWIVVAVWDLKPAHGEVALCYTVDAAFRCVQPSKSSQSSRENTFDGLCGSDEGTGVHGLAKSEVCRVEQAALSAASVTGDEDMKERFVDFTLEVVGTHADFHCDAQSHNFCGFDLQIGTHHAKEIEAMGGVVDEAGRDGGYRID